MESSPCNVCRRMHEGPVDNGCLYARTAVERCKMLGVQETGYFMHLPDLAYNHARIYEGPALRASDGFQHQHAHTMTWTQNPLGGQLDYNSSSLPPYGSRQTYQDNNRPRPPPGGIYDGTSVNVQQRSGAHSSGHQMSTYHDFTVNPTMQNMSYTPPGTYLPRNSLGPAVAYLTPAGHNILSTAVNSNISLPQGDALRFSRVAENHDRIYLSGGNNNHSYRANPMNVMQDVNAMTAVQTPQLGFSEGAESQSTLINTQLDTAAQTMSQQVPPNPYFGQGVACDTRQFVENPSRPFTGWHGTLPTLHPTAVADTRSNLSTGSGDRKVGISTWPAEPLMTLGEERKNSTHFETSILTQPQVPAPRMQWVSRPGPVIQAATGTLQMGYQSQGSSPRGFRSPRNQVQPQCTMQQTPGMPSSVMGECVRWASTGTTRPYTSPSPHLNQGNYKGISSQPKPQPKWATDGSSYSSNRTIHHHSVPSEHQRMQDDQGHHYVSSRAPVATYPRHMLSSNSASVRPHTKVKDGPQGNPETIGYSRINQPRGPLMVGSSEAPYPKSESAPRSTSQLQSGETQSSFSQVSSLSSRTKPPVSRIEGPQTTVQPLDCVKTVKDNDNCAPSLGKRKTSSSKEETLMKTAAVSYIPSHTQSAEKNHSAENQPKVFLEAPWKRSQKSSNGQKGWRRISTDDEEAVTETHSSSSNKRSLSKEEILTKTVNDTPPHVKSAERNHSPEKQPKVSIGNRGQILCEGEESLEQQRISTLDQEPTNETLSSSSSLPCKVTEEVNRSTDTVLPKEQIARENIVRYNKTFSEKIEKNYAKLTDTIQLSNLWPHLRQLQVVDQTTEARIKSKGIEEDQVGALLDYLQKNTTNKLHGFFKALCDTNQAHIISILGLNPKDYQDKQYHEPQSELPIKVQKGIASHREYYYKELMKGHLLDIEELDLPYDMKNCYIQIIATSDELVAEPKDIDPDRAMSVDPGKPTLKTGVLQGPPGAGKSSFIRHYAYKWSKPMEGEERDEQKMWDLVVILHVSTLRLSEHTSTKDQILQAIKQNLAGSEVDAIMEYLDSEKMDMKVLIIPDGMDECRNDTTLQMLNMLLEQSHKNMIPFSVFATSRSGLCPIKLSDFERRMKIEGFTLPQGVEYVKCYFDKIRKPDDDLLLEYLSENKETLGHILNNPLRTHILCVVTADGTLKLTRGKRLGLRELLSNLEHSIVRRQVEKDDKTAQGKCTENVNETKRMAKRFYMICLYSLLKDIRTLSDNLLKRFSIPNNVPYFAFMKSVQTYSKGFQKVKAWQFTHEMFHEYFAVRAIEALPKDTLQYILLLLCSSPKFRNTQKILFSSLGEDSDYSATLSDTLPDMIKATVLLQCGKNVNDIQEKVSLLEHARDPLQILLPKGRGRQRSETRIQGEEASTTTELWNSIKAHFKSANLDLFREFNTSKDVVFHIYNCLQEVLEEKQKQIFQSSIGCLLPHSHASTTWYATGGTRWSAVIEDRKTLTIHSWSPTDACQLLQQHGQPTDQEVTQHTQGANKHMTTQDSRKRKMPGTRIRRVQEMWISIPSGSVKDGSSSAGDDARYSTFSDYWGAPPADQLMSSKAWSELLREINCQWRVRAGMLVIWWDRSCPISVKGLLDALLLHETHNQLKELLIKKNGQWRTIKVWEANIDSVELCEWTTQYMQQSVVRVMLCGVACTIRADTVSSREQKQAAVKAIENNKHRGGRIFFGLEFK